MKTLSALRYKVSALVFLLFCSVSAFAQYAANSSHTATSITTSSSNTGVPSNWMQNPWVWVIGGAVVLIILIALLSGVRRTDSTVVTKTTVIREQDA